MAASLREWSQFRFMVSRFFLLSPPLSRRKVNLLDRGEFCGEKDSSPKPPLLAAKEEKGSLFCMCCGRLCLVGVLDGPDDPLNMLLRAFRPTLRLSVLKPETPETPLVPDTMDAAPSSSWCFFFRPKRLPALGVAPRPLTERPTGGDCSYTALGVAGGSKPALPKSAQPPPSVMAPLFPPTCETSLGSGKRAGGDAWRVRLDNRYSPCSGRVTCNRQGYRATSARSKLAVR